MLKLLTPRATAQRVRLVPPPSVVLQPENPFLHVAEPSTSLTMSHLWRLSKGPLTTWVAISAFPGYLISVAWPFDPLIAGSVFIGTALTSACAQTLNQVIEKDRDSLMLRTRMRPLPTGSVDSTSALMFAGASGCLGAAVLSVGAAGVVPAAIACSTAALYAGVYTPLKVLTEYNTHVGALVGAIPVLIGFAAAGVPLGSCLSPWGLFALQTLWQFPHFYALAWLHKEDYAAGGYRMAPMLDLNGHKTARMCVPYLAALTALPFVLSGLGVTSYMFAISGSIPNVLWIWLGWRPFSVAPSKATARSFFLHSLWYLIAMYGAFTLHADEKGVCKENDWRSAVRGQLVEACPHNWACRDWLVSASLCPVDSQGPQEEPEVCLN